MRLFVALPLPDTVAESLLPLMGGVPGARWQRRDQLHLTLRFIGEADGRQIADIDDALATIADPVFDLTVKGVGCFGGRKPSALWAGTAPSPALMHLQRKIETALQRVGCTPDPRKFSPHITLARLKAPQKDKLTEFLSRNALYRAEAFEVTEFTLFSSQLSPSGSIYRPEAGYPLRRP